MFSGYLWEAHSFLKGNRGVVDPGKKGGGRRVGGAEGKDVWKTKKNTNE